MKHIIIIIAAVFSSVLLTAQVPNIMNYQAVARNAAGQALANQSIKVKLTVEKNSFVQYSETRQVTTNALGLFNVQIGSTGALSTTGNFANINWQDNAGPLLYVLNVQLDINNSGLFTDMGNQILSTVPYAFASKTATETVNIGGKPVAQNMNPVLGSRLSWNGTNWIPVKKDSIYNISYQPTFPISSTNWQFLAGEITPYFVISGNERIVANLVSSLVNTGSANTVHVSVCYQKLDPTPGPITPFSPVPSRFLIPAPLGGVSGVGTIAANGAISLPAGSYRISLGVKLVGAGGNITPLEGVNGTVEIKQ